MKTFFAVIGAIGILAILVIAVGYFYLRNQSGNLFIASAERAVDQFVQVRHPSGEIESSLHRALNAAKLQQSNQTKLIIASYIVKITRDNIKPGDLEKLNRLSAEAEKGELSETRFKELQYGLDSTPQGSKPDFTEPQKGPNSAEAGKLPSANQEPAAKPPKPLVIRSPFSIPGIMVWLNARDSAFAKKANRSAVAVWPDLSGYGRDFSEDLNPPAFVSSGINRLPSVLFNGGSSTLSAHINARDLGSNPELTMFFVAQQAKATDHLTYLNIGEPSHNGAGFAFSQCDCGMGPGMTFYSYTGTPHLASYHSHSRDIQTTQPTLWSMTRSYKPSTLAWESYLYKNGQLPPGQKHISGNIHIAPQHDLWTLGQQNNTWNFFDGYMGEVIVFNRALSPSERQSVEGYLAHRWKLQPYLPPQHPYQKALPPGSPP